MNRLSIVSGVLGIVVLAIVLYLVFWQSPETIKTVDNNQLSESWNLRFGHNTPIDSALHDAAMRYAEEVSRKTSGQIKISVFPSQQLGNDHQMVEMARQGELDILLTPTAKMSVPIPSMQYADLPFFFPSRQDLYDMLDGEPGKMLLDDLREINLIGVTFWENGFKHFTGNVPFLAPEDFNNKKIRVMKSRIIMEQFKSFGAEPVPIDFHSTRQALADGVVDGQENPLVAIVSMGFHEVQSHLILSEHAYLGYVFSISEKVFEKLPDNIRSILLETALEVTPWERQKTQERESRLLEIAKQSGITVHQINQEARKKFAGKTAHIPKQFEEVIGSDIISKTEELLFDKYNKTSAEENKIIIGIDADISMGGKVAGLAIKRGVELAVKDINRNGGVLGRPLAVIVKDHRGISSKGVGNLKEFAARPDTVAVIGGMHSAVISEELEHIHHLDIPYLVPWAAASQLTEHHYPNNAVFRVSANDRLVANYIADYVLKNYKKPAILVENSIWGRGNLDKMQEYLKTQGLKFAVEIVFNRGEKDFVSKLEQVKQAGAESLIMVANPIEGSLIIKAVAKKDFKFPLVSHWGIVGGNFYDENKAILPGINFRFFQTFSFLKQRTAKSRQLEKFYKSSYNLQKKEQIKAPAGVAQAYDIVHLLALAIDRVGTTERSKVRQSLESLPPYQGVVKNYSPAFTVENHDALSEEDFYMAKFGDSGSIIPVENP